MFLSHIDDIESVELKGDKLKNVLKQVVIGPEQGWKGHVMRMFTLTEGGHTPRHNHPWPHINYIVAGKGVLFHEGKESVLSPGSAAYVPAGTEHQFRNDSPEDFKFICIVPEEGEH